MIQRPRPARNKRGELRPDPRRHGIGNVPRFAFGKRNRESLVLTERELPDAHDPLRERSPAILFVCAETYNVEQGNITRRCAVTPARPDGFQFERVPPAPVAALGPLTARGKSLRCKLAAEMGFFPTTEDVISDEEFLSYPGTCPAGFPQDDPIAREMWKEESGD